MPECSWATWRPASWTGSWKDRREVTTQSRKSSQPGKPDTNILREIYKSERNSPTLQSEFEFWREIILNIRFNNYCLNYQFCVFYYKLSPYLRLNRCFAIMASVTPPKFKLGRLLSDVETPLKCNNGCVRSRQLCRGLVIYSCYKRTHYTCCPLKTFVHDLVRDSKFSVWVSKVVTTIWIKNFGKPPI
jgi:hypothetical protein